MVWVRNGTCSGVAFAQKCQNGNIDDWDCFCCSFVSSSQVSVLTSPWIGGDAPGCSHCLSGALLDASDFMGSQ